MMSTIARIRDQCRLEWVADKILEFSQAEISQGRAH
jgi:hypothetical protein